MFSSREPLASFARRLERTEQQLDLLVDLARNSNHIIHFLLPQQELPPIPRPKQKRDFNRTCNVVSWLRQDIEGMNKSSPAEGPRYHQFPEKIEDSRISSDGQRCLEISLMFHLDTEYGQFTWDQEMVRKPRECASILRKARQTPELSVFCQTAGLWGIDMLLKTKVKSKLRTLGRVDADEVEDTAPSVVGIGSQHPTTHDAMAQSGENVRLDNAVQGCDVHPPTQNILTMVNNFTNAQHANNYLVSGEGRTDRSPRRSHDLVENATTLAASVQTAVEKLSHSFQGRLRTYLSRRHGEHGNLQLQYEIMFASIANNSSPAASLPMHYVSMTPNVSSNGAMSVQWTANLSEGVRKLARGGLRRGRAGAQSQSS